MSIYKDKVTSYRFTNNSNPIVFVNITGNVSFGDITTSVEVLVNTSTLVKTEPPGMIYKNANIWVGSSSFNSPRNIKHGAIRFRVKNSWIKENNIASVRMVKWNKIDWEYLETNEISKDDIFTYYDAFAQEFSNFAITGTKEGTAIQKIRSVTMVEPASTENTIPAIEPTKKSPGFGSILAILCLWGVYLFRRRRKCV
jgi:PGF-pre-PGF domain-containing protein